MLHLKENQKFTHSISVLQEVQVNHTKLINHITWHSCVGKLMFICTVN